MPEFIDFSYSTLNVDRFRERLQKKLIRSRYPVTDERWLFLKAEECADDKGNYVVVFVKPYSNAALNEMDRGITHQHWLLGAEMDAALLAQDSQEVADLENRLRYLRRYLRAVRETYGLIIVYPCATGSYIVFHHYYDMFPPEIRNLYPDFGNDFLILTDFVKKRVCLSTG